MVQCKNCGAFLTGNENEKCFVCNYDNTKNNVEPQSNLLNSEENQSALSTAQQNSNTKQQFGARQINVDDYNSNQIIKQQEDAQKNMDYAHFQNKQQQNSESYANYDSATKQKEKKENFVKTSNAEHYESHAQNEYKYKSTQNKSKKRPKQVMGNRQKNQESKSKKSIIILSCILASALILLVVASVSSNMLYSSYNIDKFYIDLESALVQSDTAALEQLVVGSGIEVTQEGLSSLAKAFTTQQSVQDLIASFNISAANAERISDTHPALSIISSNVFLGYNDYKLQVKPVDLNVPVITENAVLTMDGIPLTGTYTGEIMEYKGVFPGVYTLVITDQTLVGQSIQGEPTQVSLFDSNIPQTVEGSLPISDVIVTNCVQDNAIIYVNDIQVEQTPVNGSVTIPQVLVGSNIKIVLTTQSGATAASVVQYAEKANNQLVFDNYVISGGMPSAEQMELATNTFFSSYLVAINERDPEKLEHCTPELKEFLTPEITPTTTQTQVYEFVSITPDVANAKQSFNASNVLTVRINAATEYTSTPLGEDGEPDSAAESATLIPYITLDLVYTADGTWLVDFITENTLENHLAGTMVQR